MDYFQEFPIASDKSAAFVEVRNGALAEGISVRLSFPHKALSTFGIWRAFQSGVYALALEPMRRRDPDAQLDNRLGALLPGASASYWLELHLESVSR
ncbi:hypothetical protein [Mesorhizobium sp.]|uniref:hypothetical protein n=1 Tax=Mesorhizobium sp. TaxID=1871066 RepID=UPI00345750CC